VNDPVQDILERLQGVKGSEPGQWQAKCPAHDDRHASLSVARGADGRALLHCHAGCSPPAVCKALQLPLRALFPPGAKGRTPRQIIAAYDYRGADGELLYQVVRLEPKQFRQRRPDGGDHWVWGLSEGQYARRGDGDWYKANGQAAAGAPRRRFEAVPRVLYRLPGLLAAGPEGWAFVVEGEKDADSLAQLGLVATTNPMGAGNWSKLSDDSPLHGRRVAILPDKDDAGRKHARDVARRLAGKAGELKVLELPGDGKDASDWLAAGGTADRLVELAEQASPYEPGEEPGEEPADVPASEYVLVPGAHHDDRDRYTEQSNADFAGDVLARLPEEAVYRKEFIPGEILGVAGRRRWVEFGPDRMRLAVDSRMKLGKWVTSRQSKEQVMLYQPCGKDAAGVVIAHARQAEGVRELDLMVGYPVYGPGFVRIEPGWRDGLYYDEPPELAGLEPERDAEVIHGVLDELVVDFPFKTDADRENFFGLLLTPIVGPALDGSRPMHLVNSPLERTGKSKLVNEVFGGVLIGRQTPSMQITEREEEREKRILAMLLQGETLMHLDNLPHYVDSASLSSLLTAHVFGGRVLGVSRTVKLANHLTVVGTGNNVAASGEIAKRIVPVLIEPTSAHPEARSDFQHPDLRAYVRRQRRVVLECLLGLVETWLAAGRPKHPNRLGGFESWSETVGGILAAGGFRAWRTNEADWRKLADPQGAEMEAFVRAWHEAYGAADVAPKELRDLAAANELFGYIFAKRSEQAVSVAFGRMLRRHADTPVGEWFIRATSCGNASKYHLEGIE
jgi:hypothetical protein